MASLREETVSHEDYSILNDNWNQCTQLTKEKRVEYHVTMWTGILKTLFQGSRQKGEKKSISFLKKKCSHYRAIARSVAEIMDFRNRENETEEAERCARGHCWLPAEKGQLTGT